MHKLLKRQLRRFAPLGEVVPETWRAFLDAVDDAYRQADEERALIAHSMEVVSEEHADRFQRLQSALEESARIAEDRSRTSALLESTIESTSDGLLVVDNSGRIVMANRQFAKLWKIPANTLAERNDATIRAFVLEQLTDPEAFTAKVRQLYSRPEATSTDDLYFKDGRILERYSVPYLVDGVPSGRLWSFREVTQRHELEHQLRQAQKLDAVGKLAGGVAHDFNNLLTVINVHCEFLAEAVGAHEAQIREVDAIRMAAERAAGLTRQLLAFSRKQVLRPTLLDPARIVVGLVEMLERLLGETFALRIDARHADLRVQADQGQLEQVLVNLIVNARDAMPEGGLIVVRLDLVEFGQGTVGPHGELVLPGEYVAIEVIDDGCGIGQEHLDRVFEPFYTTKELGKGTGLGLSTVYGIVTQSRGHVTIESAPGEGTTIRVCLPSVTGDPSMPNPAEVLKSLHGTETILLAEDDVAIRGAAEIVLRRMGYEVLPAADGLLAVAIAQLHPGPIHLILTDVIMPNLGGAQLVEQVRAIRPDIQAMFMSGYTDDDMIRQGVIAGEIPLLEKPFTISELGSAVRGVLDGTRQEPLGSPPCPSTAGGPASVG
ncbi:MAG: ATP-binding protein [Gemmatimonadales bacterium]